MGLHQRIGNRGAIKRMWPIDSFGIVYEGMLPLSHCVAAYMGRHHRRCEAPSEVAHSLGPRNGPWELHPAIGPIVSTERMPPVIFRGIGRHDRRGKALGVSGLSIALSVVCQS